MRLIILILLTLGAVPCIAQEPGSARLFKAKLDLVEESRNKIKTYAVKMSGKRFVRDAQSVSSSEPVNYVSSIEVEVACNLIEDRWVFIGRTHPLFPGLESIPSDNKLAMATSIYVIEGSQAHGLLDHGHFQQLADVRDVPFPDPLSLGFAFCKEATHFVPITSTLEALRSWVDDGYQVEQKGALTSFLVPIRGKPGFNSTHISFDQAHGGIIRSIGMRSGPEGKNVTVADNAVVLKDGHWVQSRVTYACFGTGFFTWDLDWVSINQPLPDDLFDMDNLIKMAGRSTQIEK